MEGPAKLGIAIAISSALLVVGIILVDHTKNAPGEKQLGAKVEIQGREHIQFGAPHEPYNSNPPTSGPHYEHPADWGIYDEPLPDEQLVHNLEHGGINIFYKPSFVDQSIIDQLKEIQRDFPRKTVLAPRPANDASIALASWGYYLNLESFDEQTIREFIRRNKNRGPEFFPD